MTTRDLASRLDVNNIDAIYINNIKCRNKWRDLSSNDEVTNIHIKTYIESFDEDNIFTEIKNELDLDPELFEELQKYMHSVLANSIPVSSYVVKIALYITIK